MGQTSKPILTNGSMRPQSRIVSKRRSSSNKFSSLFPVSVLMVLPIVEDHGPRLGIRPAVMLIVWRANGYTTNANVIRRPRSSRRRVGTNKVICPTGFTLSLFHIIDTASEITCASSWWKRPPLDTLEISFIISFIPFSFSLSFLETSLDSFTHVRHFTLSPFHLFTLSPFHLFTLSPFHPFTFHLLPFTFHRDMKMPNQVNVPRIYL